MCKVFKVDKSSYYNWIKNGCVIQKVDEKLNELIEIIEQSVINEMLNKSNKEKYDNKFKDPRNVDNIVAKRGALFMMMLKRELQDMGQQVVHVKTDSLKLPGANEKIYEYCQKRAHEYGYNFEHEATFSKLALVNKAVIIGQVSWPEYKKGEWEAIGAQFAFPYVYKKLFSHEDLVEEVKLKIEVECKIYS